MCLCRDDMIHAIKFPCYDLTLLYQGSTVRAFAKLLRASRLLKQLLGAPVQLTRSAYLCLRWGIFQGSNALAFAIE